MFQLKPQMPHNQFKWIVYIAIINNKQFAPNLTFENEAILKQKQMKVERVYGHEIRTVGLTTNPLYLPALLGICWNFRQNWRNRKELNDMINESLVIFTYTIQGHTIHQRRVLQNPSNVTFYKEANATQPRGNSHLAWLAGRSPLVRLYCQKKFDSARTNWFRDPNTTDIGFCLFKLSLTIGHLDPSRSKY